MTGLPLPAELADRARDVLAGRVQPVPARDAATVVLLRPGPEVYLLRRKATMAFAAGAYVFPGGSVDVRDTDQAVAWAGPSPAEWGEVFKADERLARGLVCAAVRETFEESGVLLAGPGPDSVVADTTGDDWEADRLALIDRSLGFADFLARRGLVLRADLLKAWAHWITPEIERRRFDTRFFVAVLPEGQRTRDVGGEADRVVWRRPGEALNGEFFLMPPTHHTLTELTAYDSVAGVLAAPREIETIMPRAVEIEGEMRLVTR
ncbi:8-oxo-dGTP pyrophosphatase MutT (NUDIX family) [Nonomuraea thailandensis]|uniref:8-oxo-dGTP pyrophosphatase MutT (NUDIX family) n=1 Tax=Nonomuraea thailandensis TaxID=1188745 RepID=A0A9X2K6R5_9ACTN|nr:8-oxo-dGTP pyrophosphatase MutT (NUDIX family) [Nonomuraea thailandensis]